MKYSPLLLVVALLGMSKSSPLTLTISPQVGTVQSTIVAKVHIEPDEANRQVCLVWDSEDGEAGLHCWDHMGASGPLTTFYRFTIHSTGEYQVVAHLVQLQRTLKSTPQTLIIS